MLALGLDTRIGLFLAALLVTLLIADALRRVVRKRRPSRDRDRDTERRKYWGYV